MAVQAFDAYGITKGGKMYNKELSIWHHLNIVSIA